VSGNVSRRELLFLLDNLKGLMVGAGFFNGKYC
jgi:hypothetical protein